MNSYKSKSPIGSLIALIKPKSPFSRLVLITFAVLLFLNAAPSTMISEMTSHYGYLKLNIDSNSLSYSTEFYFNSNATKGLDPGYDASIFGGTPPTYSIYSHLVENNTGMAFAVQALSNTDMNDVTVPLGFNIAQGNDVTVSISQTDMPESIRIYLEDRLNGTYTLLTTEDYIFTADVNLSGTGRFFLIFEGDALSTEEESIKKLNIYADSNNDVIEIKGDLESDTELRLYDINGALVDYKVFMTATSYQKIDTASLSSGVYIVKLINKNAEKRVEKIIIQ